MYEFLSKIRLSYNIVLFSCAAKDYADAVLAAVDPQDQYFAYRLYRHDCVKISQKILLKDVEVS